MRVSSNECEFNLLGSEVTSAQSTVSEQTLVIQQLHSDLNKQELDNCQSNIEIYGIPSGLNKDFGVILMYLSVKLDLPNCHASEILDVHRLRAKTNSIPLFLVEFSSTDMRQKWMSAKDKLRLLSNIAYPQNMF